MPDLILSYDNNLNTHGTWLWYVCCANHGCSIKPKSRHVCVRNTGKFSTTYMRAKICMLEGYWNHGLTSVATEGKLVDLDELITKYRKYSEKPS